MIIDCQYKIHANMYELSYKDKKPKLVPYKQVPKAWRVKMYLDRKDLHKLRRKPNVCDISKIPEPAIATRSDANCSERVKWLQDLPVEKFEREVALILRQ